MVLVSVCVTVLEKFSEQLPESVKSNPSKIEDEFRKFCKTSKGKENRFVSVGIESINILNLVIKCIFCSIIE